MIREPKKQRVTQLWLAGADPRTCKARTSRVVRQLWGDGKGRFQTRGRYAAATVRGTKWRVQDRCDGTLTTVESGVVAVRDFRLRPHGARHGGPELPRPAMTDSTLGIRVLRSDDLGAVAALLRRLRGDNLYTERGVRYDVESEPDRADAARRVVDRDGIVGYAVAIRRWWRVPNDAYAWTGVVPEARGRGLGRALWDLVEEHVATLGVDSVFSDVVEDASGNAFLRARGFRADRLDRVSVLDPRTVDLDELPRRARRAAADGYSLSSLDSVRDLHAVYELALEAWDDMPGSSGSHAVTFEEWQGSLLRAPDLHAGASAIVVNEGRPVSLALLSVDLESRRGRNEETGTAHGHRRRGLATLAKLATIRWASEHGIEAILTDNTEQNVGMLAINERLGYRPLVVRQRWVNDLNTHSG